jgi:ribosomal protein S26
MKNNPKQKPRERDSVDCAISDAMRYASATKVYVPNKKNQKIIYCIACKTFLVYYSKNPNG